MPSFFSPPAPHYPSLSWPYFAIVCNFRNNRRLNSVLNKHLECSRVHTRNIRNRTHGTRLTHTDRSSGGPWEKLASDCHEIRVVQPKLEDPLPSVVGINGTPGPQGYHQAYSTLNGPTRFGSSVRPRCREGAIDRNVSVWISRGAATAWRYSTAQ